MADREAVARAFYDAAVALNVSPIERGLLLAFVGIMPVVLCNIFPLRDTHEAIVSFVRASYAGRRFRLVAVFMPCRSRSACVARKLRLLVPWHIRMAVECAPCPATDPAELEP